MLQKHIDEHGGPRSVFPDNNLVGNGHLLITGFYTLSYFSRTSISKTPEHERSFSQRSN